MSLKLAVRVGAARTPRVAKTLGILAREMRERGGIELTETAGPGELTLAIQAGIGAEGYRIEDAGTGKRILGNDERGLLYGVGKYLRGCTFGGDGQGFRHSPWTGVSVPTRPVRGIYFASHFHNFYHDAPVDKVKRYVEELALWGCNALSVWFDMHHFQGIGDPAAQAMIRRLRAILQAANGVGIRGGLTALGNEGYANSPEALRADWTAGHDGYFAEPGGHYHVEICPSKPGGLELILKTREEMLAAFADLDIGYVWNWPYDQGGCTCSQCAPWGCNGFLKIAKPYAELVRRLMPEAKIVLSTWYFDHFVKGEWEGLAKAMGKRKPEYADYLMADDYGSRFPEYPLKHGAPGGLPMLNFPEISMYDMFPWGGYGANPLPRHLQHIWDASGKMLSGGFPYSEGIFEDLNKAITLQHSWGDRAAAETVREYAAWVASPETAGEVAGAVFRLEEQHGHQSLSGTADTDGRVIRADKTGRAAETEAILREVERRLTPAARGAWRWRLLRLRAAIDAEVARAGGRLTDALDGMLEELTAIYHARNAEVAVRPPARPPRGR